MLLHHRRALRSIQRLSRYYPKPVLEAMLYILPIQTIQLTEEHTVNAWNDTLQKYIDQYLDKQNADYQIQLQADSNLKQFLPKIRVKTHGIIKDYLLKAEFFNANDYKHIIAAQNKTQGLFEENAFIVRGDKRQMVTCFDQVYHWLLEEAKKGLAISRYKGLGEMNPEQLWDTTMDPQLRRLLKVSIEDVVAADEIFTTLMGDQVEPRRQFIEENALSAENIDV